MEYAHVNITKPFASTLLHLRISPSLFGPLQVDLEPCGSFPVQLYDVAMSVRQIFSAATVFNRLNNLLGTLQSL